MREAGRGAIVNISSIASICSTNTAAYQISKAGVNTLTQHLAMNVPAMAYASTPCFRD